MNIDVSVDTALLYWQFVVRSSLESFHRNRVSTFMILPGLCSMCIMRTSEKENVAKGHPKLCMCVQHNEWEIKSMKVNFKASLQSLWSIVMIIVK